MTVVLHVWDRCFTIADDKLSCSIADNSPGIYSPSFVGILKYRYGVLNSISPISICFRIDVGG